MVVKKGEREDAVAVLVGGAVRRKVKKVECGTRSMWVAL
jgi:hypothetical protein